MAAKLITRMTHAEFIDHIRTSTERDAWEAIGDAWYFVRHARISKVQRASYRRTAEQATAAFKQTFGEDWLPF